MRSNIFYEAAVVMAIALVLALGVYGLRPEVLPLVASSTPADQSNMAEQLYKHISIEQAMDLFRQEKALFADARNIRAYDEGHIQGALHLEPQDFDQWSQGMMEQHPIEQVIITYCAGVQCALARHLAEKLAWLGFENVYYLTDGWGQWQSRGLPTTRGE